MGIDWTFALLPYGLQWRKQRKMFHQFFNVTAVEAYTSSQRSEARKLLSKFLHSPDQFMTHIRRCVLHNSRVQAFQASEQDDALPATVAVVAP